VQSMAIIPGPLRVVPPLLAGIWFLGVGVGMSVLWDYTNSPGRPGAAARRWPDTIGRVPGRASLVMTIHPHCPCSRASVRELALIMARSQGRLNARVLFVEPEGLGQEWTQTDLWDEAAAIPGVEVITDHGGASARRFGVETSGHVLLYGAAGDLLFSGGITAARGHSGDNRGRSTIIRLLTDGNATAPGRFGSSETLVFGCPLLDRPGD